MAFTVLKNFQVNERGTLCRHAGTLHLYTVKQLYSCSTYSHPRSSCPCLPRRQREKIATAALPPLCPSDRLNRQGRRKRAGARMTHSFRKAVMSVNMSHNRDLFTDTLPNQKETHRWHLPALSRVASQRRLFVMGVRSTERVWSNLAAN